MRRLGVLIALAMAGTASGPASAQAPARPVPPPRLVVVLAVDQLSGDLFDEYRPHFAGGLARLARGTVFRNGFQGHAATETCPGHATILTGSFPGRAGIIANNWFDLKQARSDKSVYCAEDERIAGASSMSYTVSPVHLRVPVLGEILKGRSPQSLSVSVAGKDRSAVMMGGQRPDQRWYWDGKAFATDLKGVAVPRSLTATNTAVANAIAAPRAALEPPPLCAAKAAPVPIEGRAGPVGAGRFARAAGDGRAFRASPEFDAAVLALAASLIQELQLGRDAAPDVIAVGLSATDYVGHSYGTNGQEMCLQLLSLDRDLAGFFQVLDRAGLDYSVVLTSDHGGEDVPERLRRLGVAEAARVQKELAAAEVGKRIAVKLGLSGPVLIGDVFGDIYIDAALRSADRARVQREALAIYQAHPQVEAVFTADQLRRVAIPTNAPTSWTLAERARASFDPERSGDLVVLLKRHITPIAEPSGSYVATHGSPWDYDRRVPILFWRPGMTAADRAEAINTADILPTLAAALGLPAIAHPIDGKCLAGIQGIACPPR